MLRLDQFTILRAVCPVTRHLPFAVDTLVNRQYPPAIPGFPKYPQQLPGIAADAPDQPRLIGVIVALDRRQPRKNAVTRAQRRVAGTRDQQDTRFGSVAPPFQRAGKEVSIGIRRLDQKHGNRRQLIRIAVRSAALFKVPFRFKLLQQPLQVDPVRPFDAEGPRDVAFRGLRRIIGNPGQDFVLGGRALHSLRLARGAGEVTRRNQRFKSAARSTSANSSRRATGCGNFGSVSASACSVDQRTPLKIRLGARAGWRSATHQ